MSNEFVLRCDTGIKQEYLSKETFFAQSCQHDEFLQVFWGLKTIFGLAHNHLIQYHLFSMDERILEIENLPEPRFGAEMIFYNEKIYLYFGGTIIIKPFDDLCCVNK
eukprot:TRINITY_DN2219_c0_g2_i1.p1 TRINITY_DN2219_c0_g2~~TRINITY_DN2219_c0_g2_i1.p1  ORF type:complete len:107 (+),score=29.31 TRINITY_DN2219_c0_g2_i1:70-390(+)